MWLGIVWEQWMNGLRTCNPCKIWMLNIITRLNNTHDWASHGGWTPIQFLILPQRSKRKVCTKQATLVWVWERWERIWFELIKQSPDMFNHLGACWLTSWVTNILISPSLLYHFRHRTLHMWIICVGRVVFIVCGWFSRTLN